MVIINVGVVINDVGCGYVGRLVDSHQKVRGEEMLAMIRHGANVVFSAKDSLATDDDIDEILKKGEKKVRIIIHLTTHIVLTTHLHTSS